MNLSYMRPLAILDLYVLSMLDRGVQSLYELQKAGGISLGASTPALKRLVKGGYVEEASRERTGKRVRIRFSLTPSGRKQARSAWRSWLPPQTTPSDLDALLRLADIATHYGYPEGKLSKLFSHLAEIRQQLAKAARDGTLGLRGNSALTYKGLRSSCDAERLRAEAKALRAIAKRLESLGGAPAGHTATS